MIEEMRSKRFTELKQESKEAEEAIFRELLIKALKEGRKINEGNNGIIVKVEGEGLNQEIKKINSKFEGQPLVSKLFKINSIVEVGNEYSVMSEARNVLGTAFENEPEKEDEYAKIPRAHVNYSLTNLDTEMVDILSSYGVSALEGGSVDVIIMDAIEGKDFNTILFEEVVKKIPELRDREDLKNLDNVSFRKLSYEAQVALGYSKPSQKGIVEDNVYRENMGKILDFFGIGKGKPGAGTGLNFPKSFFDKITNTIKLLNKNGIYHRDLHARNIMIDKNGEPFIVDFGSGLIDRNNADPYFGNLENTEFIKDNSFVETWQGLSEDRSEAGLKEKKKDDLDKKLKNYLEMLAKRKMVQRFENEIKTPLYNFFEAIKSGSTDNLATNKFYANLTTNRMLPPDENLISYFLVSELNISAKDEEERELLKLKIGEILQKRNLSLYNKFVETADLGFTIDF